MVTNDAIIIMNIGILKLAGMIFLKDDINKLESTKTKVAAIPIPMPLYADVVTASVGQRPIARTRIKLFLTIPSIRVRFISLSFEYFLYMQFLFLFGLFRQ